MKPRRFRSEPVRLQNAPSRAGDAGVTSRPSNMALDPLPEPVAPKRPAEAAVLPFRRQSR